MSVRGRDVQGLFELSDGQLKGKECIAFSGDDCIHHRSWLEPSRHNLGGCLMSLSGIEH